MRQNNNERTREIISMEEYLVKRQGNKDKEIVKELKNSRTAELNAALELAAMYM